MKLAKKIGIGILALFVLSGLSQAFSARLKWSPSCNTNVVQYTVFYTTNRLLTPITNIGPASVDECGDQRPAYTNVFYGNYNFTNIFVVKGYTNDSVIITNLVRGATYYFTVTCSTSFFESDRSKEVTYTPSTNAFAPRVDGVVVIKFE